MSEVIPRAASGFMANRTASTLSPATSSISAAISTAMARTFPPVHRAQSRDRHRLSLRGKSDFRYSNSFECFPQALTYRPARTTPRPFVHGVQAAKVVGPSGEEIFTDKYGRIKVQFPWDRDGQNDANSSCWLRVATPWAGKNWGMISLPRIGQEVVVDFVEGDPDRAHRRRQLCLQCGDDAALRVAR